jgi:hypothetical protein
VDAAYGFDHRTREAKKQEEQLSAREFGSAFKGFLEQAANGVPDEEPMFARRIREHLGADPATLEVVGQTLEVQDRPNLQLALDAYLSQDGLGSS